MAKLAPEKAINPQLVINLSKLFFQSVHPKRVKLGITQIISKVGYSYDNTHTKRHFNTLKNTPILPALLSLRK